MDQAAGARMGKRVTEKPSTLEAEILELLEPLDDAQRESLAVKTIIEHRRLLENAEDIFSAMSSEGAGTDSNLAEAYRQTMLECKTQAKVVQLMIDYLGYIPAVPPPDKP